MTAQLILCEGLYIKFAPSSSVNLLDDIPFVSSLYHLSFAKLIYLNELFFIFQLVNLNFTDCRELLKLRYKISYTDGPDV